MLQSATVTRALHLITESTGVPFFQCFTLRPVTGRREPARGSRLEALGGLHVEEAAVADGEGRQAAKRMTSAARRASPDLRMGA